LGFFKFTGGGVNYALKGRDGALNVPFLKKTKGKKARGEHRLKKSVKQNDSTTHERRGEPFTGWVPPISWQKRISV